MKRALIILLCLPFVGIAGIPEKEIKTEVKEVTVFLNGAMITRTAGINLSQGTTTLVIKNISSKISKQTIKASFSGNVKVLNVEYLYKTFTTGKQDSSRIRKIEDSIIVMDKELRKNAYLTKMYTEEKLVIELNNNISKGNANLQVIELQKLDEIYKARMSELSRLLFQLNEDKLTIDEHKNKMLSQINKLRSVTKTESYYEIRLIVKSTTATNSNLNLCYVAGAASWAPKYEIRVEGVDKKILIDYMANVANQTGEDWNNIDLKLSTADPLQSATPPTISVWRIGASGNLGDQGEFDEARVLNSNEARQKTNGLEVLNNTAFEEVDVPAVAIEFPIPDKQSVLSDGKPYIFDVTSYNLEANFEYYALPRDDKDAFLLAQITGWEKLNLIEGPTSIYFKNTYVGTSYIKPDYAGDTLNISLGRDNKLMVNRIKTEEKEGRKTIGQNIKDKHTYLITLRNTNSTSVSIKILDLIPISSNPDVEITLLEPTSDVKYDKASGQLQWQFKCNPGETKELKVSFEVKYPKAKEKEYKSYRSSSYGKKRQVRSKF